MALADVCGLKLGGSLSGPMGLPGGLVDSSRLPDTLTAQETFEVPFNYDVSMIFILYRTVFLTTAMCIVTVRSCRLDSQLARGLSNKTSNFNRVICKLYTCIFFMKYNSLQIYIK